MKGVLYEKNKDDDKYYVINDESKIDLEYLFKQVSEANLQLNEKRDINVVDTKNVVQKLLIQKIEQNQYKFTLANKKCDILYDFVKLETQDNKIYNIYSNIQFNILNQFYLHLTGEYYFHLVAENTKIITLNDFKLYPRQTIKVIEKSNANNNSLDFIFNRKSSDKKTLSSLTLNYIFKDEEKNGEVYTSDGRKRFQRELYNILENGKYRYYCGKRGIGKTISLLEFRYNNKNILYINLKFLFRAKLIINNFYSVLKNELYFTFENKDMYYDFIKEYNNKIFLSLSGDTDLDNFRFTIIKNLIECIVSYFSMTGNNFMIILDQFKKKYDKINNITKMLENYTNSSIHCKFVCCTSTNEEEVRKDVYSSLFDKSLENNLKFISINNLFCDNLDDPNLNNNQKKIIDSFGYIPIYTERIKKCKDDKQLKTLTNDMKNEIFYEIKKSIKKLGIENEVVYGLNMIMINMEKKISKELLKELFRFILMKFISIEPISKNDNTFIDYYNLEDNNNFILKYSFPLLYEIFKMIFKEYRQECYHQNLVICKGSEEGNILENIVYSALDTGETQFKEKIKIEKSYEIDQILYCSKMYIDPIEIIFDKERTIFVSEEKYIKSLFKEGKNYHLSQKNQSGQYFDGALLLSRNKNNHINNEVELCNKSENIDIEELKDIYDDKNEKKNIFSYDIIVYQVTKGEKKNKVSNNDIIKYKQMIIDNLEYIFHIKIKKFSFIYILEYESQDATLMKFCERIDNQIKYIFYSLKKNKFVNKNGDEISLENYRNEFKENKNLIKLIENNNERNERVLKKVIFDIPDYLEYKEGNLFLSKKRNINDQKKGKKNIKKNNKNFIEFFYTDKKQIFPEEVKIKKKYQEEKHSNKVSFFNNYAYDDIEYNNIKNNDNSNIINIPNSLNDNSNNSDKSNQNFNNIKNSDKEENFIQLYFNNILKKNNTSTRYEFIEEYNLNLNTIFKTITGEETSNINSFYILIDEVNILNNIIKLPLYYLYYNKKTKEKKIFIRYKEKNRIFKYENDKSLESGKEKKNNNIVEIKGEDLLNEINNLLNEKYIQENITVFCAFYKNEN